MWWTWSHLIPSWHYAGTLKNLECMTVSGRQSFACCLLFFRGIEHCEESITLINSIPTRKFKIELAVSFLSTFFSLQHLHHYPPTTPCRTIRTAPGLRHHHPARLKVANRCVQQVNQPWVKSNRMSFRPWPSGCRPFPNSNLSRTTRRMPTPPTTTAAVAMAPSTFRICQWQGE